MAFAGIGLEMGLAILGGAANTFWGYGLDESVALDV